MKKFIVFFVFASFTLIIKGSEDSTLISANDSLNIEKVLMPPQLRTALMTVDSTKEVVIKAAQTQPDTHRITIYDTVKAEVDDPEQADSFTEKLLPKTSEKDTVTPLGEIISFGDIFWSLIILIHKRKFLLWNHCSAKEGLCV